MRIVDNAPPVKLRRSHLVTSANVHTAESLPAIVFDGVTLARGDRVILDGIDLAIPRGAITVILGPSGAGKSTLLHAITGELAPTCGTIRVLDESLPLPRRALFRLRQKMGVLLQASGLLTDLDVRGNVALPVETHTDLPRPVIDQLVDLKLRAVGLEEAAALSPRELSGGMLRRVALARALVLDPPLMLYDEPLTGLDPIAAAVIVELIARLGRTLGLTSVVITHDIREALPIADFVIVVADGGIVYRGSADGLAQSSDPLLRQFLEGRPDGPIPFDYRAQGRAA